MPKPINDLRTVVMTTRVTEKQSAKAVTKCEKLEISISEYLNRLVKKDLK